MRVMTELQALCHAEQVEAARRDFLDLWTPWRLQLLWEGWSARDISLLEHSAWNEFRRRKLREK